MSIELLLKLLENVVPIGLVVLVGVGFYFMKLHQDNMQQAYTTYRDAMKDMLDRLQKNHEQQIALLESRIKDLKEENVSIGGDRNYWRGEGLKAEERFVGMIKELPEITGSLKTFYQNLKVSVEKLPQDANSPEILALRQELAQLQESMQSINRLDRETQNWLSDIETFSHNREGIAQRAKRAADSARSNPK